MIYINDQIITDDKNYFGLRKKWEEYIMNKNISGQSQVAYLKKK